MNLIRHKNKAPYPFSDTNRIPNPTKEQRSMLTMTNSELISQIRIMKHQEMSASYRFADYISFTHNSSFLLLDRQALCEWGFKTIATFDEIDSTNVLVAISYFDRFLGSSTPSSKRILSDIKQIQLVFVACLVIALKVKAGLSVETKFVSDVVCRNMFSVKEINDMEIKVLFNLKWKLNCPTAHDFIDCFFEKMPYFVHNGVQKDMVAGLSRALVELVAIEYKVALQLPSHVAFEAINCALDYAEAVATGRYSLAYQIFTRHLNSR